MKTARLFVLFFALQNSAFAERPRKHLVRTARQAVEVVRRHIRQRGGDPAREEISATRGKTAWQVTSWHIVNPSATGGSRFMPGGYTEFTVSVDGRIAEASGGL